MTAPTAATRNDQDPQDPRQDEQGLRDLQQDEQARHEAMVHAMCAAADAGDGQAFAAYFSQTARFRFGNSDPIFGRAAIARSTEGTVDAIWPVRHRVDQVARIGQQLFCRFTIAATIPDGTELAMPCVTVIELQDGLITDYAVHMDISPALR